MFSAGYSERSFADSFDPYPETIYIYGNEFSPGGNAPDREELETLRIAAFGEDGRLPDIVWDGVTNPERDTSLGVICVDNGEATVVNVDARNGYQNVSTDMTNHRCVHEKLAEVTLATR